MDSCKEKKKKSLTEKSKQINKTSCTGEASLIPEQKFEDAPCESLKENIAIMC